MDRNPSPSFLQVIPLFLRQESCPRSIFQQPVGFCWTFAFREKRTDKDMSTKGGGGLFLPALKFDGSSVQNIIDNKEAVDHSRWCLTLGHKQQWQRERLVDDKTHSPILQYFYPRALILPHLFLDSPDAILGGAGLIVGNSQLLTGMTFGYDRISRSLFSLVGQNLGLPAHFFKLAIKDNASYRSNDQTSPRNDKRVPLNFLQGFFYFACGLFTSRVGAEALLGIGALNRRLQIDRMSPFFVAVFVVGIGIAATGFFFYHGLLALRLIN